METPAQVVHETLTVLGSLAQRKESSHLRRLLEHERADVETMVSEFTALLHASCAKSSVEEAFASQKFKGRTAAEWVDKDHWIQVSMVQIMSLIASLQKQRTAASQSLERIDAALQAATQSLPQAVNSSGETECGTTSEKLNSAPDHCSDCPNFDDIVSEEQLAARLVCSDFSDFYFPSVGMEHLHSVCNVEVPKVSLLSYLIATTNGLTTKVDNINYLIAERQQCARFLNGFNLSATAVTVTTEQLITEIQTLKSDKKIQHFLRKKVSEEEKKLFDAQTELLAAAMVRRCRIGLMCRAVIHGHITCACACARPGCGQGDAKAVSNYSPIHRDVTGNTLDGPPLALAQNMGSSERVRKSGSSDFAKHGG